LIKQPKRFLEPQVGRPIARTDDEAATVDRQIEATDRKLERHEYDPHGLTEEIRLVDEATAQ
jgi:hypothetical protein